MFVLSQHNPEEAKAFREREMNRILGLPIKPTISEANHKAFSQASLISNADIDGLLPVQTEAIVEYLRTGGLFGYIGVGKGKALISFACASIAYRKGLRKILLLIPPKLAPQTMNKVLPFLRRQIPINFPVHCISGKTKAQRDKLSKEDSGVFIMSWSQLSIEDTDDLLSSISPQLIIADEAHNLSNKSSSRYKRVNRYMVEYPETEFVALSGTMGKKSIKDYYHIIQWCLKDKCPLPNTYVELQDWCDILDTTFNEFTANHILNPLRLWAINAINEDIPRDISGYRKSYNIRLSTASGVVFSVGNNDLGTSILFQNEPVEVPDDYAGLSEVHRLRSQLHNDNISPSGDNIDYAIHKFRYDYELTAGIYNSLTWADPEVISERKKIPLSSATEILERSKEYHFASQEYNRLVRRWLDDHACAGLDSPMLLGHSMKYHQAKMVGQELYDSWCVKNALDFEDRIERDGHAVRVCDYKIQACIRWVKSLNRAKHEGALIWWQRQEVGKWAYELMRDQGIDVVLADASKQGSDIINNEANHNKIILASITAYKEGLNLQKQIPFMYFLQFPREAHYVEQATGRNHRTGCPYDELVYTTNFTLDFDYQMFSAVLADALFQHQAGSPSRLIYGDFNPVPKIMSGAVLKQKGIISGNDKYFNIEQKLRNLYGNG